MFEFKRNICPICKQISSGSIDCQCETNNLQSSVWPPPPHQAPLNSPGNHRIADTWRDNLGLGIVLGLVCHITLMIWTWTTGVELGKKYLSEYSDPIEHFIFYAMVFSPMLPAVIIALLPSTRRKKFSYGMLTGSGIGLLIGFIIAAFLEGGFPFS